MQYMERRTKKPSDNPVCGRVGALNRILGVARLIRRTGNPDEAAEALEVERLLQKRLDEAEQTLVAKAA